MAKILRSPIPYKGPVTENLVEFIKNGLRKNAEHTILIDSRSDRKWTGKQLESVISRIASHLQRECGLKKGDNCTIYGNPDDYSCILILSVICAGGVSNYLMTSSKGREVHDTSLASNTKYLISSQMLMSNIRPELHDIEDKLQFICIDESCSIDFRNGCKVIGHLLSESNISDSCKLDELIESVSINPESDVAVVQFSSGTTGKPKPIPRTHKNLCHLVASVDHEELMALRPGITMSGALPITHRPGIWALLACIHGGSTLILWTVTANIEDALAMIDKYRVNILATSLTFLSALGNTGLRFKNDYDLTSLEHIITAGAKIVHSDLPENLVKELKLNSLRQCFGMTESGWIFLIEQSMAEGNYLSVGHVVPGSEVMVFDRDTMMPVESGVSGELAIRGPQVFPGYLTDEQGKLNRSEFFGDNWFRSGDQGYYDENEMIIIEGRYKELLILKSTSGNFGGKFFPNDIETIINGHPSIENSCVVKVGQVEQDIYSYDIARGYVTLKMDAKVTEQEILDFVCSTNCKILLEGGVKILEKFPRLQNGKIDKQTLKAMKI